MVTIATFLFQAFSAPNSGTRARWSCVTWS